MSKGSYPYPEDEFDVADDHGGPRGVHRAPRTTWSKAWPFLVVLIVFPALAYGLVTAFSSGDIAKVIDATSSSDDATEPAVDPSASETPLAGTPTTEVPVEPVTPTADLALPVTVYNAAKVAGLAGEQVAVLEGGGYTAVTASNSDGTGVTTTTVFYQSEDQKVTADAVAQLLGIATVELSSDWDTGVTVVLLPDFVD